MISQIQKPFVAFQFSAVYIYFGEHGQNQIKHESFYGFIFLFHIFCLCVVHSWSMALIASTDNSLSPYIQSFCYYFDICAFFSFSLINNGPTDQPIQRDDLILILHNKICDLYWTTTNQTMPDSNPCHASKFDYRIRYRTMSSRAFFFSTNVFGSDNCILYEFVLT